MRCTESWFCHFISIHHSHIPSLMEPNSPNVFLHDHLRKKCLTAIYQPVLNPFSQLSGSSSLLTLLTMEEPRMKQSHPAHIEIFSLQTPKLDKKIPTCAELHLLTSPSHCRGLPLSLYFSFTFCSCSVHETDNKN